MPDVNFDFGPMMDAEIGRYLVAFVAVDTDGPKLLGSGTLVKCKTIQGILTCGHVFREIAKLKEIGICLFPAAAKTPQKIEFEVENLKSGVVLFYDHNDEGNGRDLAFIPFSITEFSKLTSKASVVDLDIHAKRSEQQKPEGCDYIEAVAGAIGDFTPSAETLDGNKVLPITALINVGKVVETSNRNDYDLLKFQPYSNDNFTLPKSYGGSSGGGIWRLAVKRKSDNSYEPVESRLAGVVFWETDAPKRKLIGHGPISIYGHLLKEIYCRWK